MNHCDPADNREANLETVQLAKKYLGKGVCAMDMAGYEEQMENFAELFELARELGIPATTHSEFTVGKALEYGTTRIGHGYQAALLPELTEAVIKKGVTLEMCPDSSLSYEYGLSGDETHPLYVLYKKGARVTVNTDNLTVLDTDLEKEYALCRKMGFTDRQILYRCRNTSRCKNRTRTSH
jgi:adenosine deaminase